MADAGVDIDLYGDMESEFPAEDGTANDSMVKSEEQRLVSKNSESPSTINAKFFCRLLILLKNIRSGSIFNDLVRF